jgi:hypothetical protein
MCAALLLGYALAQQSATGDFGLSRFSGWPLYGRVAPFADCTQFTPPAGTAGLCQANPPSERPGPLFYVWWDGSPAHRVFGSPPKDGSKVGAFALAAILAQPGDYAYAVLRDMAAYVDPSIRPGPSWGGAPGGMSLNNRQPVSQVENLRAIRPYYGRVDVHVRPGIINALTTWQGIVRTHGWMIGLAALLGFAGIFCTRDRGTRAGLALLLANALSVVLVSTMVSEYSYRYALPSAFLLMVAGARGAEVVIARARSARLARLASTT